MGLREVVEAMGQALGTPNDGRFHQTGGLLGEEKARVRELLQMKTAPQVATVINKLKFDQPITREDVDLIRVWVVGDAEGYIEMENSFESWVTEYARLREALGRYVDHECSVPELLQLQGLIEDTVRVSFDIANYLEKKERIENFDQTTRDLDKLNRPVLAAVLSRKLESDES